MFFAILLLTTCLCQCAAGRKYGKPCAPSLFKKNAVATGFDKYEWEELMFMTNEAIEKHAKDVAYIKKDNPQRWPKCISFQHHRNALEVAIMYREILESILIQVETLLEQYAGVRCDEKASSKDNKEEKQKRAMTVAVEHDPFFMGYYVKAGDNLTSVFQKLCSHIRDLKESRNQIESDRSLITKASEGKLGLHNACEAIEAHKIHFYKHAFLQLFPYLFESAQKKANNEESLFAGVVAESTLRYRPPAAESGSGGEQRVVNSYGRSSSSNQRAIEFHMRNDAPQFIAQPPQQPPQYPIANPAAHQQQYAEPNYVQQQQIIQHQQQAFLQQQQQQAALMQPQQQQPHPQQQQFFIQPPVGQGQAGELSLSRRLSQLNMQQVAMAAANGQQQQQQQRYQTG